MIECERGGRKREERRMLRCLVTVVECEVPEENQYEDVQHAVGNSVCNLWTGLEYTFRKHYPLNQYLFNSSVCYWHNGKSDIICGRHRNITDRLIYLFNCCNIPNTRNFPGGSSVKNLPAMQETEEVLVWSLGWEDPLEKGMVTLSSLLVWKIPWTEEPGKLQSGGSQRAGHDWSNW